MIKNVCIFGASSDKLDEKVIQDVTKLSEQLGKAGFSLVFGGFSKGLMKASADCFHSAGADIYGVVPESLMGSRAVHEGCTKVYETSDLDERKQVMTELADAFIAVPGGIGTLDELFGVMAQNFIGEISKPIVLYNPDGFYDSLIKWMEKLQKDGYIYKPLSDLIFISDNEKKIVEFLLNA